MARGVLVVAGGDPDRTRQVGFPAPGRRQDQQVRGIGTPAVLGIPPHPRGVEVATVVVADFGNAGLWDRKPGLAD